jgi:nucleoside-diphosphate-sugar epimerase
MEGLNRGMDVTVAVRATTSRRYLTDERLHFLVLDYDNSQQLTQAINEAPQWDYIIYNLGATKAINYLDFKRINYEYLRRFTTALTETNHVPTRLLMMSSLSALGPGDEQGYKPLSHTTQPRPNTRYGQSKIMAEQHLEHFAGIPYIIFRPTGVYGPHEKDYLMMIQSIDNHFDFGVGYRKQMLTFIYVDDLVNAMFDAFEANVENKKYIIAENRAYTQKEFRDIVSHELNKHCVIPVKLPLWATWVASVVAEKVAKWQGKTSTLNGDKFKIMRQRNWNADISQAVADFGFNPQIDLREGIHRTVQAYLATKQKKQK